MDNRILFRCPKCGDEATQLIKDSLARHADPYCGKCDDEGIEIKMDYAGVVQEKQLNENMVKVHLKCKKCGYENDIQVTEAIAGQDVDCPNCMADRIRRPMDPVSVSRVEPKPSILSGMFDHSLLKVTEFDREHIENILFSDSKKDYNWFSCHLLRLMAKCDEVNRAKLGILYPEHRDLYDHYMGDREPDSLAPIAPEMPASDGTVTVVIKDGLIENVRGLPVGWDWAMDDQDLT